MRKLAVLCVMLLGVPVHATVRCGGARTAQPLTVNSGQSFTLPVQPVTGALDYEVARTASWSLLPDQTWLLTGSISESRTRPATGDAPAVTERLYNTAAFAKSVYYIVTATNAFGGDTFQPCAQDFLITVNPDPVLSRDSARGVVPVAGSLRGANGSRYETRLTLVNPWSTPITGTIVFHPTGKPGAATDPSLTYSIASQGVQKWDDVVAAMNTSGLGSLDVVPDRQESTYTMPDVRAQVVSVAANGGAYGSDVPLVTAMSSDYGAFWTAPGPPMLLPDDQHGEKRLAIGVRSLSDGADVTAYLFAPDGSTKMTVTRHYDADVHEQRPLSDWFGSAAEPTDRVALLASHASAPLLPGGAIFYLAETDNVTNDVTVIVPQQHDRALSQPVVQCSLGCQLLAP